MVASDNLWPSHLIVTLGDTTVAALTTRPRSLRAVGTGRADDEVGMRSPSANAGFAIAADATLGPHRCTDAMAPAETNRQQHTESHRELRETQRAELQGARRGAYLRQESAERAPE